MTEHDGRPAAMSISALVSSGAEPWEDKMRRGHDRSPRTQDDAPHPAIRGVDGFTSGSVSASSDRHGLATSIRRRRRTTGVGAKGHDQAQTNRASY